MDCVETHSPGDIEVSVVIAAHNEAPTIGQVVQGSVANTPGLVEVLVVDDGSTDDTARIATQAGARVVQLKKNYGKGYALRYGIEQARGNRLVFLDGDGQDDPTEIPLLLKALGPQIDMVIGSRFLGSFRPRAITRINRAGSYFLTTIVNALFATQFTDTQAGFRAVRMDILRRANLRADTYDIETDMLLRVLRVNGRVIEVPVSRSARRHGASGLRSIRDGTRILLCILRLRFIRAI